MNSSPFATISDMNYLWRRVEYSEENKAKELLSVVSNILRQEAQKVGKDLDERAESDPSYREVLRSVTVDIVGRALLTSTESEPMVQSTESALGYSVSGTYLVPGGGIYIKKNELAKLGLRRQRFGVREIYGDS